MEEKKITGRAKGGVARAKALSPETRSEIAKRGARGRWGMKATHRGNFKDEFGIDVECYVLDDDHKTAVISQRGMGATLGMGIGGSRLPTLVNSKRLSPYVGQELRGKLEKPLIFQAFTGGPNSPPPSRVHGFDVTILVDICKAVLAAEADGQTINPAVVRQAHIVLSASAKAGIKGLVYALSGYDATKEEVIAAFKAYLREEAREYEKEFPPQLYEHWYRLYGLNKPQRGRPWKAKSLTIDHVYYPLARSNGRVLDLARALKAKGDDRNKKLHQFLSDLGVKALRMQVGQLLGVAGVSSTATEYEGHVNKLFGSQRDLPGFD